MQTVTQILVDFSGSMKGKLEFAKRLLLEEVIPTLDYSAKIGVKTFKSDNKSLKTAEILPLSIVDIEQLNAAVSGINSPDGGTPIAAAIRDSLNTLKQYPAFDKRIILVTDGEETDGGDYEEEARKAGEEGIHCQIHIIGIALKQAQLVKANSISNYSKGSTSNIPYTNGVVYNKTTVQTSLMEFKNALKKHSNPTYSGSSITSGKSANSAPQQAVSSPLNSPSAPLGVSLVNTVVSSNSPATSNFSQSILSKDDGEPNIESTDTIVLIPTVLETPRADQASEDNVEDLVLPELDMPHSHGADEANSINAELDLSESEGIEKVDSQYLPEHESVSTDHLESQLISGILNEVLQKMDNLSRDVTDLKIELNKGREEVLHYQEQFNVWKEAANEVVSNLLAKRYGDRVESSREAESDQVFKVLFEENGPVEYYVLCKIMIDDVFYLSKKEWRLFLNNTKNIQVYLMLPAGSKPEYILIDNLLDWMLRGKVVPYLTMARKVEAGVVNFSLV